MDRQVSPHLQYQECFVNKNMYASFNSTWIDESSDPEFPELTQHPTISGPVFQKEEAETFSCCSLPSLGSLLDFAYDENEGIFDFEL